MIKFDEFYLRSLIKHIGFVGLVALVLVAAYFAVLGIFFGLKWIFFNFVLFMTIIFYGILTVLACCLIFIFFSSVNSYANKDRSKHKQIS